MSWSSPVASVKGTVIRVHFTFLLLLAWIGSAGRVARRPRHPCTETRSRYAQPPPRSRLAGFLHMEQQLCRT